MKFNYEHGGDIYTEGLLKGRELIDFSSNINPLGVPDSFKSHINEAVEKASYYPDVCYRELIENLKGYLSKDYKIDGLNYILGNGAVDVIDKVIGLFKKVLITVPCFSEYESIALRWENKVVYSYLNDQMEYDYRDIEKKINDVDALIIANPNNPSGNIIHKEKFMDIIKLCEDKKKTIIIDEAFVEFTGDKNQSFIAETHEYKCLFVIRALTKYFGLPGIRFGYAVTSNNNLKNQIEKYKNTWNINCFAEVAAKYVLKDYKYIEDSQKWIRQEKKFMLEELTKIKIIEKAYNTHSNFILVKLKGILGEQLYRKAMDNGIAIRRAANFKGLDDNFVRLAIKSREDNKKLLEVLKL